MNNVEKYILQKQANSSGIFGNFFNPAVAGVNAGANAANNIKNIFSGQQQQQGGAQTMPHTPGSGQGGAQTMPYIPGSGQGGAQTMPYYPGQDGDGPKYQTMPFNIPGGQSPGWQNQDWSNMRMATPEQMQGIRQHQQSPSFDYSKYNMKATPEQEQHIQRQQQQQTPQNIQSSPKPQQQHDWNKAVEPPRGNWGDIGNIAKGLNFGTVPGMLMQGASTAKNLMQAGGIGNQGQTHSGGYGGTNMLNALKNFIPK